MPRQPIIDAHEWISEILAVPGFQSGEAADKGTDLFAPVGKEDPVEFDSNLTPRSDVLDVVR